ncbi:MAG TPA: hypothetical protein PKD53_12390 [Chloroflexaceae bacterium]|nr:hypothetical protein [Chloroflexaceae bacterium]
MSLKERFTPAEWADLSSAPFAAAMYVATADGGRGEYVREMVTMTRAVGPSLKGAGELARALFAELGGRAGRRLGTGDQAVAYDDRPAMLAVVARAGAALARAGGAEAAPYASWVIGLARRAARASSSGGLLGVGGRPVSAAEEVALRELKTALGAGSP